MARARGRQKESAGLVMFRRKPVLEVLLAHPGGPYWAGKHDAAWTIPKGGMHPGEVPLETAIREFGEETGFASAEPFLSLGHIVQRSGKIVHAWAFEGDADVRTWQSVTMTTEWPPRSGRLITVPEIDRVEFYTVDQARRLLNVAQAELLDRLISVLT